MRAPCIARITEEGDEGLRREDGHGTIPTSLRLPQEVVLDRICSYLTTLDNLAIQATAPSWASHFGSGVRCMTLCRPVDQPPTWWFALPFYRRKTCDLVQLLTRQPRLQILLLYGGDWMVWALGRALLLQPQPSSLEAMIIFCGFPSSPTMALRRLNDVGLSYLAQAMTEKQLPSLVILDLSGTCFKTDAAVLLWEALASGACPKLRHLGLAALSIARPDCLQAMAAAFDRRMDLQCDGLDSFLIGGLALTLGLGYITMVAEADLLRGLEGVLLSKSLTELRMLQLIYPAAGAVGAYLAAAKRLKLRELVIGCNPSHPETFESISGPLMLGAAPGLEMLTLLFMVGAAIDHLTQVFKAGKLASLKKLHFSWSLFDREAMARLMEGVLSGGHRGAALRTMEMRSTNKTNGNPDLKEVARATSKAFIQGLRDGAFPNLEVLRMDEHTGLLRDDHVAMELVAALELGAPCAQTLRNVKLGCSEDVKRELRHVLPRAMVE